MLKLQEEKVYFATLEKEHCRTLWETFEYDSKNVTESMNIGEHDRDGYTAAKGEFI